MAGRRVNYEIHSTDKSKSGISSAMQNLRGFDDQIGQMSKKFKSLLKFGAIAGGIRLVAKGFREVSDAFKIQETADRQLAVSIKNNPLLNGTAFASLKKYNSELQNNSIYGDEQLNGMAAQLSAQGKTEQQIKDILSASANLAAAGVMPLESAVKNLSKTYSGLAGELGESIPAMRELTAVQLANGEGVALVAEKYKNMAVEMSRTREGMKQMVNNVKGDIQENLGDIFTTITGDFNARFLPIFQKINEWLNNNKEKIINLFKYFPQIAADTFNLIKGIIGKIFTVDFWTTFASIAWDTYKNYCLSLFKVIGAFISAIGSTLWEPLKWGFRSIVYGIKTMFAGMINFFIGRINGLSEVAHDLGQKIAHPFDKTKRSAWEGGIAEIGQNIEGPGAFPLTAIGDAWKAAASTASGEFAAQAENMKDTWSAITAASTDLFGGELNTFLDSVNEKLTIPVVTALEAAGLNVNSGGAAAALAPGARPGGVNNPMNNTDLSASRSGGGFASFFSKLAPLIEAVAFPLMQMITGLSAVNALMSWQATILKGIMSVIGPVIDTLLTPLVGILRVVGQTIGALIVPVLSILGPIIAGISTAFIWLYNFAILPFGNLFIKLGNLIYNGFIGILNGIIKAVNVIPGVSIKKLSYRESDAGSLEKINMADLNATGAAEVGSSTSGTAAAYSGGKNIINNWYISIGAMTGDQDTFQEFVRLITLQQTRAARLGLT